MDDASLVNQDYIPILEKKIYDEEKIGDKPLNPYDVSLHIKTSRLILFAQFFSTLVASLFICKVFKCTLSRLLTTLIVIFVLLYIYIGLYYSVVSKYTEKWSKTISF